MPFDAFHILLASAVHFDVFLHILIHSVPIPFDPDVMIWYRDRRCPDTILCQ